MFRYERPQKGRYRQFHQIDAEVIGAAEPRRRRRAASRSRPTSPATSSASSIGVTLQLNTLGDRREPRDA